MTAFSIVKLLGGLTEVCTSMEVPTKVQVQASAEERRSSSKFQVYGSRRGMVKSWSISSWRM